MKMRKMRLKGNKEIKKGCVWGVCGGGIGGNEEYPFESSGCLAYLSATHAFARCVTGTTNE